MIYHLPPYNITSEYPLFNVTLRHSDDNYNKSSAVCSVWNLLFVLFKMYQTFNVKNWIKEVFGSDAKLQKKIFIDHRFIAKGRLV